MAPAQNPALETMIGGALDWWRDAGVDCAFADDATQWLAEKPQPAETKPAETKPVALVPEASPEPHRPAARPAAQRIDPAAIPDRLAAFGQWWLSEPLLAEGSSQSRIAPRGPVQAELMVIVPEPEREDTETLLRGPQGRLLDAMLAAFGLNPDQAYVASALPRNLPGADWQAISAAGIGAVLQKHVALVAPKRIAVFGGDVLPLLGHAPPQGPADLREINQEDGKVPMLACRSLAALLEQPRWKARVWQAWLDMTQ
jgi:uracil-DNA glycosylase